MIRVVRHTFRGSERVGQSELPVQGKDAAATDGAHDRHPLAIVLVDEDGDLGVLHELLLEPRADLFLQLGWRAAGRLDLPDERNRDDSSRWDAQPEL